jgi:aminoglycoside phosphotransferase (APT) family kinase protein
MMSRLPAVPAKDMPAAEVDVDEPLVRALLAEQHPDLADLPIEVVANGWDNAIVRVGDALVARLPRRELAVPLVEHEQRWLPELAPRLPLPIPAPVRIGRPSDRYPWPWSLCPWFDGVSALVSPPSDLAAAAELHGRFFSALHQPAPADAPANPYRGVPLAARHERTMADIDALDLPDPTEVIARWRAFLEVAPHEGPPVWVHGDPHPGNLLVHEGRLAAVIDFGDLCAGDRACDLAVAWMLYPSDVRPVFRAAAGDVDDATWARAHGWALAFGLVLSANAADHAEYSSLGAHTLGAALADPGP